MATKLKPAGRGGDSYMEWIQRFPLKTIKDETAHELAVEIVGQLLGRRLDAGAGDYLDTLILLVNAYEDRHHSPVGLEMTPQQCLQAIMEANGLSQADIGRIVGSESAVSMFLKGERGLSKSQIKALVEKFRIDAGLLL